MNTPTPAPIVVPIEPTNSGRGPRGDLGIERMKLVDS